MTILVVYVQLRQAFILGFVAVSSLNHAEDVVKQLDTHSRRNTLEYSMQYCFRLA